MKRLLLLLSLTLTLNFSHAQKIQLKKGVITRDSEPIGKLEGEAGWLKGTDVSIHGNDGTALLNITSHIKSFSLYEPISYYSFQFPTLNKTVAFVPEKFYSSERNLVEFLFENIGKDFLTKDGLNADLVYMFATGKDQSETIAQDTTYYSNLVRISKEKFEEPLIKRDLNNRVQLQSLEKKTINQRKQETLETYDIIQGGVVIGKLSKHFKGDPALYVNGIAESKEVVYTIQRRVTPFTLNDKTIEFVNMAKVKGSIGDPSISTHCDKAGVKDFKPADIFYAETVVANWFIYKGCL
jgi:hypothetical protein